MYSFCNSFLLPVFGKAVTRSLGREPWVWCFDSARVDTTISALPHGSFLEGKQSEEQVSVKNSQPLETVLLIECNCCQKRRNVPVEKLTLKGEVMVCSSCKHPTMHKLIEIEERRKQNLPIDFPDRRKSGISLEHTMGKVPCVKN